MLNFIRDIMGYIIVLPLFMVMAFTLAIMMFVVLFVLKTLDVVGLAGVDEKRALTKITQIFREQMDVFSK